MNLNFGAGILKSKKFESNGMNAITKMLKKAQLLKYLKLDFENNKIDNSLLKELIHSIKELPALFDLTL